MGSTRFSPVLDTIKKIHISAADRVVRDREAGREPSTQAGGFGCGWTGEVTTTGSTAYGHEPEH